MQRLTKSEYWDGVHRGTSAADAPAVRKWERRLGKRLYSLTLGYAEHLIWDVYYPKLLENCAGKTAIEIGSAPGHHLVALHRQFGCDVFGVEYSPDGAAMNRQVFSNANINPAHVMQADFFSADFQRDNAQRFDVVLSRGFIEHFTNVDEVILAHVAILKPGGLLIVSIPNVRGLNFHLARFFHVETIALHNLDIMRPAAFRNLFEGCGLKQEFCGLFGIFDFGLFNARLPGRQKILNVCMKFQRLLNPLLRLLSRPGWWENRWTSPYMIYAGRKT